MDEQQTPSPNNQTGKKTLWIVIAVLIILGVCWWLFMPKGDKNQVKNNEQTTKQAQTEGQAQNLSLKELFAEGKTQKCQTSFESAEGKGSGQLYIGNGKMRTDMTMVVGDKTLTTHMITDNSMAYTWIEGQNMAFKMPISQTEQQQTETQKQGSADLNTKYAVTCTSWNVDESLLTPPANINFLDQTQLLQTGQTAGQPSNSDSLKTQQCAACDSAGDAKEQCKTALGCK